MVVERCDDDVGFVELEPYGCPNLLNVVPKEAD